MRGTREPKSAKGELELEQRAAKDRKFVMALARGLELLRAFDPGDDYLGNAELAERTGIPRPTVTRLTYTLTTLGYLRYSRRLEKYQLGIGVLALGYRYLASMGIRDLARPHMQALAESTDCMVALGTADRLQMTYIEVCQGTGPVILRLDVGSRIPIAQTSMGRAYLAALPEAQRREYFDEIRAADRKAWPETKRQLERALEHYQETGFCISEGEWESDISGVGVPLVLEGGVQVLAFNCGGATLRLTHEILEERLGPRLLELVRRVEAELQGGLSALHHEPPSSPRGARD